MLKAFRCRLLGHKWKRMAKIEEEAYVCDRCGEIQYGKLRSFGTGSLGGDAGGGDFGGGGDGNGG